MKADCPSRSRGCGNENSGEQVPHHLPGAAATPVASSELWNTFFSVLGRAKTPLANFWHSLRSAPPGKLPGQRGRLWPMPVPYPDLHRPGGQRSRSDVPRKLALNATVLVWSWLYLGQPATPRRSDALGLGTPLSSEQWAVVETLGRGVEAWNAQPLIGPEAMGRNAAKVESCEEILRALEGKGDQAARFSFPAGGHEPSAEVLSSQICGTLNLEPASLAQSIVPERLRFFEEPSFDPRPFLSSQSRAVYRRPLDFARPIPEEEAVPRTQVRCSRDAAVRLLEVLDKCGRLALRPREAIRDRVLNGLFAIPKDLQRDRMILDARAPNQAEAVSQPWLRSMASLEQLQWLELKSDEEMRVSAEDLKEFYHCFQVEEQRICRNGLALKFRPWELKHLSCYTADLASCEYVRPCLKTLAMGDCCAVGFGQESHLGVLLQSGALRVEQLVTLTGRPPRQGLVGGLLIDDLAVLERVKRGSSEVEHEAPKMMKVVHDAYAAARMPRNQSKSVAGASVAEFWGGSFDGIEGTIRPAPRRTVPLAGLLLRAVGGGLATPELLEVFAGSLVSIFQCRRRLMSILERIYAEPIGAPPRAVMRMSAALKDELLVSAVLVSQACIDFRTPGAPVVVASDASSRAEAATCAPVSCEASAELCRHGLQKRLWSKLLKPVDALLRERGELADDLQLPSGVYSPHPCWETLSRTLRFKQLGKTKYPGKRRHINVGELRAALAAESQVGRRWPSSRYLHLQDSQVSLACLVKGRSSSRALNVELRKSLGDHLGFNVRPAYGFLKTHLNPADDPTRGKEVRLPSESPPGWLQELLRGEFASLDQFLARNGVHLDQLREVPASSELMPDAPVPESEKVRRPPLVSPLPAEKQASRLLEGSVIFKQDLVRLLRVLPTQPAPRGQPKPGTKSFQSGLFVHGGVVGFRSATTEFPLSTRAICRFVRESKPNLRFSSVGLFRNMLADCHVDANNSPDEPNYLYGLSKFRGGGLWIAGEGGSEIRKCKGRDEPGHVMDIRGEPVLFNPHLPHATEGWAGSRYVVVAYCVRGLEKLSAEQRAAAAEFGFRLPEPVKEHVEEGSGVQRPPGVTGEANERGKAALDFRRPPLGLPLSQVHSGPKVARSRLAEEEGRGKAELDFQRSPRGLPEPQVQTGAGEVQGRSGEAEDSGEAELDFRLSPVGLPKPQAHSGTVEVQGRSGVAEDRGKAELDFRLSPVGLPTSQVHSGTVEVQGRSGAAEGRGEAELDFRLSPVGLPKSQVHSGPPGLVPQVRGQVPPETEPQLRGQVRSKEDTQSYASEGAVLDFRHPRKQLPEVSEVPRLQVRTGKCFRGGAGVAGQGVLDFRPSFAGSGDVTERPDPRHFSPGQFVYSSRYANLGDALSKGQGWVDLFSGSRGLAKAVAEAAPWWVICFDWRHDSEEDLRSGTLRESIKGLLDTGQVRGFSADPPAGSFSTALTPAWRTREWPEGVPGLEEERAKKVRVENEFSVFCSELIDICERKGLSYLVANPDRSRMWRMPEWRERSKATESFIVDFCRFGTSWKKATRIVASGQLAGQKMQCAHGRAHAQLRGRCPRNGITWTLMAESFPKKLCQLLAAAVAQDEGYYDGFRKLDIGRCAKVGGLRVGEAANPGPRQPQPRTPACLSEVELVEPKTAAVRDKHWRAFLHHLRNGLGEEGLASVMEVPSLLVSMLCSYAQVMYDAGTPLHYYRQLLAHAQRVCPTAKPLMRPAWDYVTKWERLEPLQHRPPVPVKLVRAMAAVGLSWGWTRWAAVTLLCFYSITRIGEVLAATRKELLTREDAMEPEGGLFLLIRKPKTRNRGARVQHAQTVGPEEVLRFLERTFQSLTFSQKLYGGSPGVYRRRWDAVLRKLGVPSHLRLTPGSLRGGGAVYSHKSGTAIGDLQWRMRVSHQNTLGHYLQETTAASVLPSLSPEARNNVLAAEAFLHFLMESP